MIGRGQGRDLTQPFVRDQPDTVHHTKQRGVHLGRCTGGHFRYKARADTKAERDEITGGAVEPSRVAATGLTWLDKEVHFGVTQQGCLVA
ncbi:hypothetical protein BIV24_11725 [Streptomyces colonosanans]|uniref:Uncharacterized protein n=1 Tax=Streptomyces colonosanans TaxID=1428652 RepID=A0A1S2PJR7_9ACTN|nr:hypothetical protein BIV24_11725 [Streptomyces colonosanans]